PDGPRKIAAYLAHFIKPRLAEELLKFHDIAEIKRRVNKTQEQLVQNNVFDPFKVLSIDTVLIAPRHLYRMPYSLNEKSGLVSVPIHPDRILAFDKASAKPELVTPNETYIRREQAVKNEASKLFIKAFDFVAKSSMQKAERDEYQPRKEFDVPTQALSENLFPPCIKLASQGMKDGKKRALFAIVNFLTSVGWDYDKISEWLKEWNKRNPEPLSDTIIEGHVRYHKQAKKKMLPPNCRQFWEELGICKPDGLCNRIKNPVSYATRKAWMLNRQTEEKKAATGKWTEEDFEVK
ncbi:MAG TPA: hypothetical protein VLJ21_04450, partial [Candidatus Binatia bacterium]|nr:hypothetical protein [Candidatus Binatia bacterium]